MTAAGVLYSDVIRERWRRPRHRGDLPGASGVAEDVNPLCGDRVRLAVQVIDGKVADARFIGDSCAICTASADVVIDLAIGRSIEEAAVSVPRTCSRCWGRTSSRRACGV